MRTTPKILIVDDSAPDRELLRAMLRPEFAVLEAQDVPHGLEVFLREQPDCVLLDHHMPGVAGLDGLMEFVRLQAVVIMMSGSDGEEIAPQAFKRGARDFIRKDALTKPDLQRIIVREHERRRLELDLQASKRRFDEVAARIAEVLWVRSLDGEFLYLSPAFEQVWVRSRAGVTLEQWSGYVHPEDRALCQDAIANLAAGVECEIEFRIIRPDGEVRRIRDRGYPIFEGEKLARFGGIARDVTQETRLQQELRLAQKLEAIGQLAAGIAHEINTPAQYVSDNLSFMSEAFADLLPLLRACHALIEDGRVAAPGNVDDLRALARGADLGYLVTELPSALQQTATGMTQIKKIVQAMKEFSHPSDDMKVVDLNHAVETTMVVASNEWKYVADVELDLEECLPQVPCHPSQINQVLLNMIVNAAHAIGDKVGDAGTKGKITLSTRATDTHAVITITDDGCGIPEDIRDKIYDPFFTTKAVGKGTGQGLAIAHRVISQHHGGTITCESKVGEGTSFIIRLPLTAADDTKSERIDRHALLSAR